MEQPNKRSFKPGFRFRSLKFKIFIFNFMIVIGMFFLFGLILLKTSLDRTCVQALAAAKASLNQTSIFLEEKSSALRNTIDAIVLDSRTIDILTRDNRERYRSHLQWNIDYITLERALSAGIYYSDIEKVRVLTQNEIARFEDNPLFIPLPLVEKSRWYAQARDSLYSYFWNSATDLGLSEDDGDYICFTRNLTYSYYDYQNFFVGYIHRSVFDRLLNANRTDGYASYFIVNSSRDVLTGSDTIPREDFQEIKAWVDKGLGYFPDEAKIDTVDINNRSYYLGAISIPNTDLTLVYTYASFRMAKDMIKTNVSNMLLIMLAVLPLVLIFSLTVTFSVTKRIDRLKRDMMRASEGNFGLSVLPSVQDDEVGILTQYFNYMLTKISMLLDSQYKFGKRIKELELKSLQAQINPHFLYNTLDLIKWRAAKHNDTEIKDLVTALSGYYRISLSRGEDTVSLQSELEHIAAYVYIQNKRFDDGIRLRMHVSEGCLSYKLPKLTLQPIVENAITHGLLEKDEASGAILIKSFQEGASLILAIVDDGIGMTQAAADRLLTKEQEAREQGPAITRIGYGLRNIDERVKLTFGNDYGLSFISHPGSGTAVLLTIPALSEQEGGEAPDV